MTALKLFLSPMWGFLKPMIAIFLSQIGPVLATAAQKAVIAAAASVGEKDGNVKRKIAFDIIMEDLKSQGIAVTASTVNAAIEVAVQKLKTS